MIALLIFSLFAFGVVAFAGRKDQALDPKLTTAVLLLLAAFPLFIQAMPKVAVFPQSAVAGRGWAMAVLAVWTIGFLVSVVRLCWTSLIVARWRKRSVDHGNVEDIEIRLLPSIRSPMAAGVFRKIIFLPVDWSDWEERKREWALAHEISHHHRKDPLRRWIAGFAVAVNWFNPLVRWIVRRLLIQCEYACDEAVLKQGGDRKSYASLLCDLAEEKPPKGGALAMSERSGLESRVRRIMLRRDSEEGKTTSCLILFSVSMAGLLSILGAEQIADYTRQEIDWRRTADPFPGR